MSSQPEGVVRPGIDVLLSDSLHLLTGRRVGLLTNQTGVGRDGSSDVHLFLDAGVQLTALFSPEHGFRGGLDTTAIGHDVEATTGLPIYSLYGETREPTPAMMDRIDLLVIDLQDIGARPYTYISTALLAMRAARAADVPVVVADRPNPIGGVLIQGPILSARKSSFVGMLQVPLRHGMTFGELARYGNDELEIGAEVTVAPVDGWRRSEWFDAVELPWVRPSPNMPSLESATHYPGVVMFEATNLSVGRGTPLAFQVVGAPWLEPSEVLGRLPHLPGVALADTAVVPDGPSDGKYAGRRVRAIRLSVTDRDAYNPVEAATELLAAIHAVHRDSLEVDRDRLARLAGTDALWAAVSSGRPLADLYREWDLAIADFRDRRERFVLYR
jgi:uncharacterized protein YbbC (DUF1343 family)